MIDRIEIQQTINRYSEAASRADWDEVVATYLPEGIWEIVSSGRKFLGRAAIKEGLMGFTSATDYVVQINAPAVIALDGNTATARSVIRECGRVSGRDQTFEALGFYADILVRTEEGWRFARRAFELKGMHHYALLPAAAG